MPATPCVVLDACTTSTHSPHVRLLPRNTHACHPDALLVPTPSQIKTPQAAHVKHGHAEVFTCGAGARRYEKVDADLYANVWKVDQVIGTAQQG